MENRNVDYTLCSAIRSNLERCILGKRIEIERLLTALLAGGHVLLEDVPGTGKTQLVKALARTIGGQFRRVQCNPDLLPTDITGVAIYHPKDETFVYRPGPVMTNLLLVDEINRATTKTQSALLEAMEERHVTVDGDSYELPQPFILIATQNPIEFEGTYTLPEAQLDRFMMKLTLGYPDAATERQMVLAPDSSSPADKLLPVADIEQVAKLMQAVRSVHVDEAVGDYLIRLVRATREHSSVLLGASPRAAISLMAAAKANAFLHERDYVIPDDIKGLIQAVLSHRMVLHTEARMNGSTAEDVIDTIVRQTNVPVRLER
ncbi:AAA family ATPase [Paenibacillus spongiae]|uniref:MoxR family ATPase n=1 Tax=Paenibacillus spongiae TaxID=2909671 RepID=A0ABY5SES5_9BACL|nr:MoxR family ATPase [Paenibacillus spongiae]UVI32033.1 MoxR family ATPase [Paenibacillus spongiae]